MKTTSLNIEDLRVPCSNHCRYCLLACNNDINLTDYWQTEDFVRRIAAELKDTDIKFDYYMGYCMDTPYLTSYIQLAQEYGFASADFLQLNGLHFRNLMALNYIIGNLRLQGIKLVDLTFYGLREYHDRFAGRTGDYDYLVDTLRACNRAHLPVRISMPITKENMDQTEELYNYLTDLGADNIGIFLPHCKGRGENLENARLTDEDYSNLPEVIREHFYKVPLKTERDWLLENNFPEPENRILTMVLKNGTDYLDLSAAQIIRRLEEKDDLFHEKMPTIKELAGIYGEENNHQLFRKRDLIVKYQKAWAKDHPEIEDTIEEYRDFSIRY